jgi:Type II secretory pathway, ATPase PulE/Tfp pilus assembly pathway, ATPase PilB
LIYGEKNNNYFLPEQFNLIKKLTNQRGLIVTSGPTGSGKTSTMYELAQVIGKNKVVMTIEDPVEVWNPDFLQTQVNLIAGITYPDLLKAALRHRPDILIIGEIRDQETAKISINAALSGHLGFSYYSC